MLNLALYWMLRAAAEAVRFAPLRAIYALADAAGMSAYFFIGTARRGILSNLSVALPERGNREHVRIARACFRHDARNWVDTLRIPHVAPEEIERSISTEGREHLHEATREGGGAICVTMHLGNFDLVGQSLQTWGYHLTMPVERMSPPQLFDFLMQLRETHTITLVPVDRAPRELLKALRRGGLVGVAGDRDVTGHGVVVPFFGRAALLPKGPAVLARHTGAPMLLTIGVRSSGGRYRGFVSAPIEMQRTGDDDADDLANTAHLVPLLEDFIRRFPEQWLAFSPIWTGHMAGSTPATMSQQREAAV